MELITISDCLSLTDFAIVENVKMLSIKSLEGIRNYLLKFRQTVHVEINIALLNNLKQINCIIHNFFSYEDDESFYNEYMDLRKLLIAWIVELDNQEN